MEGECHSVRRKGLKRRKRVDPSGSSPNPLFEKWLTEWRDEAERKQLKTKYVYEKALRSLKKYPLTLKSGREAKILEFFGDKICDMLDDKLSRHRLESGLIPEREEEEPKEKKKNDDDGLTLEPTSSLARSALTIKKRDGGEVRTNVRTKDYVPAFKSGSYALLLALYKAKQESEVGFMSKTTLMEAAQPLCEKSFKVPEPGSYYTAWSSMGTLIKKNLVGKEGNPARYSLTDSGFGLVVRMMSVEAMQTNDPSPSSACSSTQRPIEEDEEECPRIYRNVHLAEGFKLLPGQFDIVLCVDNCETVTGGLNARKQQVQTELKKNGVTFDVRKLHVGDFLWIAREKVFPVPGRLHLPEARELVLDYIVERKRKDDLASSITDGRFKEQKSRMKNCALRNPIYLIEECGSNNHFAIPESTLLQAVTNTQIVDGFTIKQTQNLAESVAYLTIMTRYLQSLYSGKTLFSRAMDDKNDGTTLVTFDEFNRNSMKIKPLSTSELFFKQLLQLNGVSVDRGKAIVESYPTPSSLMRKLKECAGEKERENVLSFVTAKSGRNLGPTLSKVLCQFYTKVKLS